MKIVTLMENTSCSEVLTCEHGLSLYLETENHKILFDAGQSAAFADNAEKLGIDPTKAEDKEKYTIDGLHFNDDGHHILAARLQEFLEAL